MSKLDLSPPPGLLPDLPPDAPAPSFNPPVTLVVAPATEEPKRAEISRSPETQFSKESALAQPDASTPSDATPLPQASPSAVAPALPGDAWPETADALADAIHATLDSLLAEKSVGRPIGAGDWGAARKAIAAFYAERGYAPLWVDGDHFSPHARSALDRLAKAGEDGLNLAATPAPASDWRNSTPSAQAQAEVALSAAIVAYALQASGARINPHALSKDVFAKPEVADPVFALKSIAAAADPDAALAAFNPPQAGYRELRSALADLHAEAQKPLARLGPGPVLRLGMSDPRVPLIRARFRLGPLTDTPASDVYDVRLVSAVAAFQRVHGLPANGALTEATATALEGMNIQGRQEQLLLANMEMWRWEPREMGAVRVEVNLPDFSLKLFSDDNIIFRTRVIVGKPDTPTPLFSNAIKYMLFNPVWHVPDSIIKKEMEPRFAEDPSYFTRHGYKVSYDGDKMIVEQPPGEANALGRMLFLFPNEHAVYLHDTPMRSLFSSSYRAFSHGCVRVEDPTRLAEILMGGAARGWTDSRVHSLLGAKEKTLSLPSPVPVHLQYFTEFVNESGKLEVRDDIYGLTAKVASDLAKTTQ